MKTKPLMPFQAVTQTGLLPSHDLVEIIDRLHKASGGSVGSVSWVDVTGKPAFSAVALTGLYSDLVGIPATFAPSAHVHDIADTTGLQAALDAKQPAILGGVAVITLPGWRRSHRQTIAAVGVTPAHRISAALGAFAETDINSPDLLDVSALSVAPGTDQITITAAFTSPTSGPIPINWSAL